MEKDNYPERIEYEEFIEKYKPKKNHLCDDASFNGWMFETYGKELEAIRAADDVRNIWTLIDTDGGLCIIAGYHFVNRFGYFITEKKWDNPNIEVYFDINTLSFP